MSENTPCEHGYSERSWCGKCMRADAPKRTPLSERIRDRQTAFRDEGDVRDRRGYIVDDAQLAEVAALEKERDELRAAAQEAIIRSIIEIRLLRAALHEGGNDE
jgi:hypothetical protein